MRGRGGKNKNYAHVYAITDTAAGELSSRLKNVGGGELCPPVPPLPTPGLSIVTVYVQANYIRSKVAGVSYSYCRWLACVDT